MTLIRSPMSNRKVNVRAEYAVSARSPLLSMKALTTIVASGGELALGLTFLMPPQLPASKLSNISFPPIWPVCWLLRSKQLEPTSVQFSSVQSCSALCNPMNRSTPGLPVHHQLPEFIQTHVHRVSDAIQPSYPLLSPSPLAPNPS